MATDPIGRLWLNNCIAGKQRTPGQIGMLRHPPNEGGAQAILVVVVQSIIGYLDTAIRRRIKVVVSFQDCLDSGLYTELYTMKNAICEAMPTTGLKSALNTAFPMGADGKRAKGCMIWFRSRPNQLQKNMDQRFDFSDPYNPLRDLPREDIITTPNIELAEYVQRVLATFTPPPTPPPRSQTPSPEVFRYPTGRSPTVPEAEMMRESLQQTTRVRNGLSCAQVSSVVCCSFV